MQTFTFYPTDLCTVIDKSLELGVKYLEVFPGQKIGGKWGDRVFDYNLDVSTCKELLKYTASKGVKIVGTGVFVPGKSDEWDPEFAFAKTMKLDYISCEPALEDWNLVERLAKKTGIKISVHNHPQPSEYWTPMNLLNAIRTRSNATQCFSAGS